MLNFEDGEILATRRRDNSTQKGYWIRYAGVGASTALRVFPVGKYIYYGSPGGSFAVRLTLKNEKGEQKVFEALQYQTRSCELGEGVTSLGVCKKCDFSKQYSFYKPEKVQTFSFECKPCGVKDKSGDRIF